ncbi:MAG: hypothetical protein CL873_04320 [Dehalococcoidales bacterium]|nr:hypothetical protein [Dehalococcoidales bacterium]
MTSKEPGMERFYTAEISDNDNPRSGNLIAFIRQHYFNRESENRIDVEVLSPASEIFDNQPISGDFIINDLQKELSLLILDRKMPPVLPDKLGKYFHCWINA